jgi:hypothetical protein
MGIVVSFPPVRARIQAAASEVLGGVAFPSDASRLCAEKEVADTLACFSKPLDSTFSFSTLGAISPQDQAVFHEEFQAQLSRWLRSITEELLLELVAAQVKLCIAQNPPSQPAQT